jgi:hypothetical protein
MDYSTLNLEELCKLKIYRLPPTYYLQQGSGYGCAGDPPGYPTYFTRSVYTKFGNKPPHGPHLVITYDGQHYIVDDVKWEGLWKPLPLNHPRVRLWVMSTYRHHQHCYNGHGDNMVIYPVSSYQDDPRWKDEYREAHRAEVDEERARELVTPGNHNAVRIIRAYYPEHEPDLDLIANPPQVNVGSWWETEAEQPSEEKCAETQRWGYRHPFNGSWCQWCGRGEK